MDASENTNIEENIADDEDIIDLTIDDDSDDDDIENRVELISMNVATFLVTSLGLLFVVLTLLRLNWNKYVAPILGYGKFDSLLQLIGFVVTVAWFITVIGKCSDLIDFNIYNEYY